MQEEDHMPLKMTLKPGERMILAGAAITNGRTTANLIIENNVPILREKDILNEKEASSPARRIYYVIQLMYLDRENRISYHGTYWDLVRDYIQATPSALSLVDEISGHLLKEHYYSALKIAKKLIRHEDSIISSGKKKGE